MSQHEDFSVLSLEDAVLRYKELYTEVKHAQQKLARLRAQEIDPFSKTFQSHCRAVAKAEDEDEFLIERLSCITRVIGRRYIESQGLPVP